MIGTQAPNGGSTNGDLSNSSIEIRIYNTTGMIYWQALSEEGKELTSGNISLTVEEVEAWGDSMDYIENLVLDRLNLTKKQ